MYPPATFANRNRCRARRAVLLSGAVEVPAAPPPIQVENPVEIPVEIRVEIHAGDNLAVLRDFPDESFDLIYLDPPFNTGREQARTRLRTTRDRGGDRTGFGGRRYRTTVLGRSAFPDRFDEYREFLEPRLREGYRLLRPDGSFFLHLDFREVHYQKVVLDGIFGRESFLNEIIWAYDYGARSKKRWSPKHDNLLWYAKDPKRYTFRHEDSDRIPYLAPALVGAEKAARGKTPTDTWWNTVVSPTGKEKTGYPTQKPLTVLDRIVRVHSNPGDTVLDYFAGSGTTGEAAARAGRHAVLVDENPEAVRVMARRLAFARPVVFGARPAKPASTATTPEPVATAPPGPTTARRSATSAAQGA